MTFGLLDLAWAALVGGGVGVVSGMFGAGGGFLIVPVLSIILRIPVELAVGAGACQGLGTATTALLARRAGLAQLRLPLTIAGGLFMGVYSGAAALRSAGTSAVLVVPWSVRAVPAAELLVLLTYFLLLASVGVFALWEARQGRGRAVFAAARRAALRIPPVEVFEEFQERRMSIPVLAWFGLIVGFFAGLLGMNGGLILLPGMMYLLGLRTRQAVVSSLVIVWLVSVQSTIVHAWHGHVNLLLVVALLVSGTVGARLGVEVGERLGGRRLRSGFGWLLLGAAALIAVRLGQLLLG